MKVHRACSSPVDGIQAWKQDGACLGSKAVSGNCNYFLKPRSVPPLQIVGNEHGLPRQRVSGPLSLAIATIPSILPKHVLRVRSIWSQKELGSKITGYSIDNTQVPESWDAEISEDG